MTLIENTFALSTNLLKKDLRKAREKETAEGYLNIAYNGRPSVIDYCIEYENGKAYLVVVFNENTQRILLSKEELTFGTRSYLVCACGNRVNALYLDKGIFACRNCHKLRYQSTTINRNSRHGQFLYQQSQLIKAMDMRENINRIFYKSKYTKKFDSYLNLCARLGLFDEVLEAQKLLIAINR